MRNPLVSICVPVRGPAPFLEKALRSALAQGVDDVEVIVQEQGFGGAGEVVARLGDPRLKHRRGVSSHGVVENRNACLARARGHYIAWLDADDEWLPGSLAARLAIFDAIPGAALVHGTAQIIGHDGSVLPAWRRPLQADVVEPAERAFAELLLANEITTSTVVVRRAVLDHAGSFVSSGPTSSDWDMWLRLALRGDVAFVAAPMARYRQHAASISATVPNADRLDCDRRVIRRVLNVERALLGDRRRMTLCAGYALAARALLSAQHYRALGNRRRAIRQTALACHTSPKVLARSAPGLMSPLLRDDGYEWHLRSRRGLAKLAYELRGSRYGRWLDAQSRHDEAWDAAQARIAAAVRQSTPETAIVATAAKWDPTILHLSDRRGCNFPDRRLLPEGYPADGARAAAHVDDLCGMGVTHVVFPRVWNWWLDSYDELGDRLGDPVHADDDCLVFAVPSR